MHIRFGDDDPPPKKKEEAKRQANATVPPVQDDSDSSSSSSSSSSSESRQPDTETKKTIKQRKSSSSSSSSKSSDDDDSDSSDSLSSSQDVKESTTHMKQKKGTKQKDTTGEARTTSNPMFDEEAQAAWSDLEDVQDSDSEKEEEGDNLQVSLNALKRQVLGRDLRTYDDDTPDTTTNDLPAIESLGQLQKELNCPICHEVLYEPVSLTCGHSFCRCCLHWWLDHSQPTLPEAPFAAPRRSMGQCPTCRCTLSCEGASLGVNTALRATVAALFKKELHDRIEAERMAQRKLVAGEDGGAHSRGYEVLSDLTDVPYKPVTISGGRWGTCAVRRSIVLDAQDQRMQLALSLRQEPSLLENTLEVQVCLLTMEEDEAGDGQGFPVVVREDDDDEHFICREDRLLSIIECKAKINDGTHVPLARRAQPQEEEGVVLFSIDMETPALEKAAALWFRHQETGATLELKLPSGGRRNKGHGESLPEDSRSGERGLDPGEAARANHSFVLDEGEVDYVDSNGVIMNLDRYEDDGFVVMEADDEEESHDDEDVCCLCKDGGELIVCDGGDHIEGCGRPFHIRCVHRNVVPPGDWVCESCANEFGLNNVGIEGHEFAVEEEEDIVGSDVEKSGEDASLSHPSKGRAKRERNNDFDDENDSDEEEILVVTSNESAKRQENGDESDGSLVILPPKKSNVTKRRRVLESDDDE